VTLLGTCKEIAHLLSDALDRPLTPAERLRMHVHLPICSGCRNYRAQLQILRAAARQAGGQSDPDA
jgi:predicted anti-sigma-YlaC factor YlaD